MTTRQDLSSEPFTVGAPVASVCNFPASSLSAGEALKKLADEHECARHPLFDRLEQLPMTPTRAARLLRNYDAHASVLRRLLLKAATIMPEEAVGYVLENVRNEYGNGTPDARHQLQLIDLALKAGATPDEFRQAAIERGVRRYICAAAQYYFPAIRRHPNKLFRPAIAAGAITATELLAVREFLAMQAAFAPLGLANHVWFDHVRVEVEHGDEALALAMYFIEKRDALKAVQFGMVGVLDANVHLYDGLLAAIER